MDELKQHNHTKKEQQAEYNKIKENLASNKLWYTWIRQKVMKINSKIKCKARISDIPILACLRHAVMPKKENMVV